MKTQLTPTPPAPEMILADDNFRRWEFQAKEYVFLSTQATGARVLITLLDGEALDITTDMCNLRGLEDTRDPSTRRAFLTVASTSTQEAVDRADTTEQVNGVLERDQQYLTRKIAPVQYRPMASPQPLNRRDRYGPQRT
ncbi:hypothetical protein EG68_12026 [Paragonimus skrjabini miyazakii]|uniref:Uncharacterized protein n=1 Tax=Paragonimus skrjabini miyazakii TaxID=59628 RepID=A0A8S9YIN4_9TREM|nr:hypothetical protein EG68_12026 [Paragonimus skrjabini miyazakii]